MHDITHVVDRATHIIFDDQGAIWADVDCISNDRVWFTINPDMLTDCRALHPPRRSELSSIGVKVTDCTSQNVDRERRTINFDVARCMTIHCGATLGKRRGNLVRPVDVDPNSNDDNIVGDLRQDTRDLFLVCLIAKHHIVWPLQAASRCHDCIDGLARSERQRPHRPKAVFGRPAPQQRRHEYRRTCWGIPDPPSSTATSSLKVSDEHLFRSTLASASEQVVVGRPGLGQPLNFGKPGARQCVF